MRILKKRLIGLLSTLLLSNASIATAEVASFSAATNTLHIPVVKVEDVLYDVTLNVTNGNFVLSSVMPASTKAPLAEFFFDTGKLLIPDLKVPMGNELLLYFKSELNLVPGSSPLQFELASAELADPLKIGSLFSFTGIVGEKGGLTDESYNSAILAIKHLNEAGFDAVLISEDTASDHIGGHKVAQRLVDEENVQVLLSGFISEITAGVAQEVAIPNKLLQISYGSPSPALTAFPADEEADLLFRTQVPFTPLAIALAQASINQGYRKLSILYANILDGQGFSQAFQDSFTLFGGEIVTAISFELEPKDSYQTELEQAAQGGAEALVFFGLPGSSASTILQESITGGFFSKFLTSVPFQGIDSVIPQGMETLLEGSCSMVPAFSTTTTTEEAHSLNYEAEYGTSSTRTFGENAYDAVVLAALAGYAAQVNGESITSGSGGVYLREVANPPGEEVTPSDLARARQLLEAGESINYTGASGNVDFDIKGDVSTPLEFTCFQGGQPVVVESWDLDSLAALLQQVGDSQRDVPQN